MNPTEIVRNQVNEFELREANRLMDYCKENNVPPEVMSKLLDSNREAFEKHREALRERGINV